MDSFLEQTARAIIDAVDWTRLSRTTLVLPSHRAGLVLKDALLRLQKERHAQAVWAPQVTTLPQLQDQLSPLYAEEELFTVVRLYRLFRGLTHSEADEVPLDMFYNWGRQMIADFTNIDASMPAEEVPNFFSNTIAAHELSQWHLDPEVVERLRALVNPQAVSTPADSVREQYEQVWRNLYELYKALRAEMTAEQKGFTGMRQRAVIEHWDEESVQSQLAGRTYIFVGFNYLLPVERELMERLRDSGQAMFFWDYVTDFQTNERAFSFARLNAGILGDHTPSHPSAATRPVQPVTIISCTSREAQAQYVHQWLKAHYTAHGQHVGIVICDETMLEPVIYTLPAITLPGETEPEPINITKGFPLRNTKIYSDVNQWLLDRKLGDAAQIVSPEIIDRLTESLFPSKEQDAETAPETETTPDTKPLNWKELLILESEYQVRKILNQMRQVVSEGLGDVPFTLKLLRLLLRRSMESVTMPFHGEPVTDIQVMGVLETRMLDFDALLLLNVEEGVIPQRQNDSSFIPYYLRKAYRMQTSDERATVYAYNFFRLLSRAEHATVLYALPDNSDAGKGMSRFLMQINVSPEFAVTRKTLYEPGVLQALSMSEQPFECPSYVEANPGAPLSPSALNTYIACPRMFAWRYIKHTPEPPQEELVFAPATFGSFVHHMMEYIYVRFFGCDNKNPKRIDPDQLEHIRTDKASMQQALDYAYSQMVQFDQAQHVNENVFILSYVDHILARDCEDARTGLQVWKLEQKCQFPLTIEGVGTIRLAGKVDRVDILTRPEGECIRVIDYKTGHYTPDSEKESTAAVKLTATWQEVAEDTRKDNIRQTLIYSYAVALDDATGRPIEPNLYYCQRDLTRDVTTHVTVENRVVTNVRELGPAISDALKPTLSRLLTTTDFPMCEGADCKKYCPYLTLCGRTAKEY